MIPTCSTCRAPFDDTVPPPVKEIRSTVNDDNLPFCIFPDEDDDINHQDSDSSSRDKVTICAALSTLFRPISSSSPSPIFGSGNIIMCSSCAESLTQVYNNYKEFIALIHPESEVGKKLGPLEGHQKKTSPGLDKSESGEKSLVAKRGRGRPRKTQSTEVTRPNIESPSNPPSVSVSVPSTQKRGRGRPPKCRQSVESPIKSPLPFSPSALKKPRLETDLTYDELIFEPQSIHVKDEPMSDFDFDVEDGDLIDGGEFDGEDDDDDDKKTTLAPPTTRSSTRNTKSYESKDPDHSANFPQKLEDVGNSTKKIVKYADDESSSSDEDSSDEDFTVPDNKEVDDEQDSNNSSDSDAASDQDFTPSKMTNPKAAPPITSSGGFTCPRCSATFAHQKSYRRHYLSTHAKVSYSCPKCDKRFTREDHVLTHRRGVHGETISSISSKRRQQKRSKKHPCPLCPAEFSSTQLSAHLSSTHADDPTPWKCSWPNCPHTFTTQPDLSAHTKSSHRSHDRVTCSVCGVEYRDKYKLKKHQRRIHHVKIYQNDGTESAKNWGCDKCEKRYKKECALIEHKRSHGIGEPLKCDVCGALFRHKKSLERHMRIHEGKFDFVCGEPGCEMSFLRKDKMRNHMRRVHNIKEEEKDGVEGEAVVKVKKEKVKVKKHKNGEEIPCAECGKMVRKYNMKLHMVTHTGEKTKLCYICGRSFGCQSGLNTHLKYTHAEKEPLKCTLCGVLCKRPKDMRAHLALHDLGDQRPYVCQVPGCGKGFRSEKTLKSHHVVHTPDRGFFCTYPDCDKSFNRIDNMRAHVAGVHEGKQVRKKRPPRPATTAPRRKRQRRPKAASQKKKKRTRMGQASDLESSSLADYGQNEYILPNSQIHENSRTTNPNSNERQIKQQSSSSSSLNPNTSIYPPDFLAPFSHPAYY